MKWPQDFDGKHAVAGEAVAAEHGGVDEEKLILHIAQAMSIGGRYDTANHPDTLLGMYAAIAMREIRPYLHPTPSQVSAEDRPDGVHTFKEMEALALDWKRKFHERVDSNQELSMEFHEFRDEIAKALGIKIGSSKWWDIGKQQQKQKLMDKIAALKKGGE